MTSSQNTIGPSRLIESVGRRSVAAARVVRSGVEELGLGASLLAECLFWLGFGRLRRQPVRVPTIFEQMMEIGIRAIPIGTVLSFAIGVTLAMQGIDLLKTFGAESQVVLAVALSVVREFSPLIMGILVAGRSGSALAARLGTMNISQELDALRSMSISPVRFLVAPTLLATLVMLPMLTFWSDLVMLAASALYTWNELGMSFQAYGETTLEILTVNHLMHGLGKSVIFAVLIVVIATINGLFVSGGAEGVGRATTRSVVMSIAAIIVTDMLFILLMTRSSF